MERELIRNSNFKFKAKAFTVFSLLFSSFFISDIAMHLTLHKVNTKIFYIEVTATLLILVNLILFFFSKQSVHIKFFLLIIGILAVLFLTINGINSETLLILFSYPLIAAFTIDYRAVVNWNIPIIAVLITALVLKESLPIFPITRLIPLQSEVSLFELLFGYLIIVILSYFLSKSANDATYEIYNFSVKDPLTGLFNRAFALSFLEQQIEEIKREPENRANKRLCVTYIDLDNFKVVNDTYGHSTGDSVLRKVSTILHAFFRKEDVVARLGGDEFLVISLNTDCESLKRRLEKLRIQVEKELKDYNLSLSFGVAEIPEDTVDAKEAIDIADRRMYLNKQKRKRERKREVKGELPSTEEPTSV